MMKATTEVIEPDEILEYRVQHRMGCVLIFGAVPATAFQAFEQLVPRKSVMSQHLAREAGASFAFGLPSDIEKLRAALRPTNLAAAKAKYGIRGLSEGAVKWLASGERGASSEFMFQHITGVTVRDEGDPAHPHDPDDFRRCRLMLESCAEIASHLDRMRSASPVWARLVDAWPAICAAMDKESPGWRACKGNAKSAFKIIRETIENAK